MGESTGGFNSLLLLAKGTIAFERAALLCPGFAEIGPFSTEEEIQNYISRNKPFAQDQLILKIIGILKAEFPEQVLWKTHAPFAVLKELSKSHTKFYISGNTQDEYGFGEGAHRLQEEMAKISLQFNYEIVPGRHCVMNPES